MKKVLIVDDDLDTAAYLSLLIQDWGYEVVAVNNGAEAIASITERRPDVIISDVLMPGMDGETLLITTRALGCKAAFILLTGHPDPEGAVGAIIRGADEYLIKPVDPYLLRNTLAKY